MTKTTERKIPSVYSFLSNNKKIKDQVRIIVYVVLMIGNIFQISLTRNRKEAHMVHLARKVKEIWRCYS